MWCQSTLPLTPHIVMKNIVMKHQTFLVLFKNVITCSLLVLQDGRWKFKKIHWFFDLKNALKELKLLHLIAEAETGQWR